jgi:predicted molibdopterin-dependent oxidoreductase YjgC
VLSGNYPSDWVTPALRDSLAETPVVLIDTIETSLCNIAQVVLPGATWCEKDGTFENVKGRLQSFDRAIAPVDFCRSEAQIGIDLGAVVQGWNAPRMAAAAIRTRMAEVPGLQGMATDTHHPQTGAEQASDMAFAEL